MGVTVMSVASNPVAVSVTISPGNGATSSVTEIL
jgi:hypothetical protein